MKKLLFLAFLLISIVGLSQKKIVKKFETETKEIHIYTAGLDDVVLENSSTNFIEIDLVAESYDHQTIEIKEDKTEVNVNFYFEGTETREVIFRKFITKRLQRASAIVKIPKGKKVTVFGENIDIQAKDLRNELSIYIDNGIVKLNQIQAETNLKLYSGNVYASTKNTNLVIKSNKGKIKVDDKYYQTKHQFNLKKNIKKLKITSIKANIYLTAE